MEDTWLPAGHGQHAERVKHWTKALAADSFQLIWKIMGDPVGELSSCQALHGSKALRPPHPPRRSRSSSET